MAPRRLPLRVLVGCALGLATGITLGCLQEDGFVSEYAAEVCRMVRDCGRELHLPGETDILPATAECEAIVVAHYSSCGSSCTFNRTKARRCLRRLRDNHCPGDVIATGDGTATDDGTAGDGVVGDETASDGTASDGTASDGTASDDGGGGLNSDIFGDGLIPIVCSAVYEQCNGGEDQDTQCSAPSCSIGSGAGGGWLALLGLVLLGSRRRWYLGRR